MVRLENEKVPFSHSTGGAHSSKPKCHSFLFGEHGAPTCASAPNPLRRKRCELVDRVWGPDYSPLRSRAAAGIESPKVTPVEVTEPVGTPVPRTPFHGRTDGSRKQGCSGPPCWRVE